MNMPTNWIFETRVDKSIVIVTLWILRNSYLEDAVCTLCYLKAFISKTILHCLDLFNMLLTDRLIFILIPYLEPFWCMYGIANLGKIVEK